MKNSILFFLFLALFTLSSCGDDDPILENFIHYDGDNATSPVLPAGVHEAAIHFPASLMSEYNGREVKTIEFYLYDLPVSATMTIYSGESNTSPGSQVLYQHDFNISTLRDLRWNFHVLSGNLLLDGSAIWVGFRFENGASQQTIGCDAGPVDVRGGDWLYQSTDNQWLSFQSRTGDSINWNIRVELEE